MKTAISLPDATFEEVTARAQQLGMSRSEFFARAARRYLDALDAESATAQIDRVLAAAGHDDSGAAAVAAGLRRIHTEHAW